MTEEEKAINENSLTRVLIDRCKELGIKDLYHLQDLLELAEENKGLKRNLSRYSEKIAEQEETIDAQDEKINFYVSKMNKALTENEELKEHIKEVENDITNCEIISYETISKLKAQIENYKLSENESKEIIAELKSKLEKEQNLNKVIKERLVEVKL